MLNATWTRFSVTFTHQAETILNLLQTCDVNDLVRRRKSRLLAVEAHLALVYEYAARVYAKWPSPRFRDTYTSLAAVIRELLPVATEEIALHNRGNARRACLEPGIAALHGGQTEIAWEQFAAVLAEEPDDAEAIHWLLCAGTALERWEALADHLLAYLRLTPGDLAVRFALAGLYVRLADWEAARQEYETLRLLQPTFEGLEDLALAIDQGEPAAAQHTGGVAHPSVAS